MMTTKKFSTALGNIGENFVDEAVNYSPKTKKNSWVKWVPIAACLSLILLGGLFGNLLRSPDTPHVPDNNIMSYFVITAYAANGESTELNVSDNFLSSGTPQHNIFGHNLPTFHFDVKPSDLKSNEAIYERFDISVSYNETIVGWNKDEHISLAIIMPTQHSDEPWGYSIIGWFTEPTDIIINILDKESREIVETITVNVKYDADRQEYELKIVNLDTEYTKQ